MSLMVDAEFAAKLERLRAVVAREFPDMDAEAITAGAGAALLVARDEYQPELDALRAELAQVRQERDEARAYADSRREEADKAHQQREHRTLTLGAAIKRAEQAEAEVQRLRARLAEVHDRLGEQV